MLDRFAKFRVVVGELTSAVSVEPRVPTKVFLFPNTRSYRSHGGPPQTAGVFNRSRNEFNIALDVDSDDDQELFFHEYTHLLIANTGAEYPIWYNEGFAELMSTVRFRGDQVYIGNVPAARLESALEVGRWIPLEKVLEGEVFELRRESDKAATAYAQAWVLTHYVTFGDPELNEKIDAYIPRALEESDPVAAFSDVFGVTPTELEPKLHRYVLNGEIQAHIFEADQFALPTVDPPAEPLTPAETASQLARMCRALGFGYRAEELRGLAMEAGEPDPFATRPD